MVMAMAMVTATATGMATTKRHLVKKGSSVVKPKKRNPSPGMNRLISFFDQETKRLVKNSSWVFLSNFYSTGLAFVRSVLIARGLGATLFGSYTLVVAFVGLVQEFLNLNLGTALIKFGAGYHAENRNDKLFALVKASMRVSALMALLSVIAIVVLTCFQNTGLHQFQQMDGYVIAYAIAASITYFNSISRGMLRLYYRFRISSIIEIIMDTVETVVVGVVLFFFPKDISVFFPAIIVVRFINAFICNFIAFLELKGEWSHHYDVGTEILANDRRAIQDFVIGNSLGNTLKTMISQGDVLLLGLLTGPEQVAYYAIAKKLAYAILTITDPLASSIYPQLAKLLAERKFNEATTMLGKITRFSVIPAAVFFIVMYFLHQWMIVALYGAEFTLAASSFMFFLAGALLGAVTFWTLPLVQSLGLIRMRILAYLITIVAGVALSYLLIPSFNAAGMAMALLITNILNATIFIYFSFRRIHLISHSKLTSL